MGINQMSVKIDDLFVTWSEWDCCWIARKKDSFDAVCGEGDTREIAIAEILAYYEDLDNQADAAAAESLRA